MTDENKDLKALSEEELNEVSGGMVENIPGMHYDPTTGLWVEDGPSAQLKPGNVTVGVAPK